MRTRPILASAAAAGGGAALFFALLSGHTGASTGQGAPERGVAERGVATVPQAPPSRPAGAVPERDRRSIADLTERWYRALADRDGATVCGLMTPAGRRRANPGTECAAAVAATDYSAAQRAGMRRVRVDATQVVLAGDEAQVPGRAFSVDGRNSTSMQGVRAARVDGEWLVDDIG